MRVCDERVLAPWQCTPDAAETCPIDLTASSGGALGENDLMLLEVPDVCRLAEVVSLDSLLSTDFCIFCGISHFATLDNSLPDPLHLSFFSKVVS